MEKTLKEIELEIKSLRECREDLDKKIGLLYRQRKEVAKPGKTAEQMLEPYFLHKNNDPEILRDLLCEIVNLKRRLEILEGK